MSTRRKAAAVAKMSEDAPEAVAGLVQIRPLAVQEVCAKGDLCLLGSDGLLFVARSDILRPRRVRVGRCRSVEAQVLFEWGDYLVLKLDGQPMPFVQAAEWCEEVGL